MNPVTAKDVVSQSLPGGEKRTGEVREGDSGVGQDQDGSDSEGSDSANGGDEYEVEKVLDYKRGVYLVKWKGWSSDSNTWEPLANLGKCEAELIRFYLQRKAEVDTILGQAQFVETGSGKRKRESSVPDLQLPPDPRPHSLRVLDFYDRTRHPTQEEITKVEEEWRADLKAKKKTREDWGLIKLKKKLDEGAEGVLDEEAMSELRIQLLRHELDRSRETALKKIKKWEEEINKTTKGLPTIRVENDFDLVGPPPGFVYINEYVPRGGIQIPDDPPLGCSCTDCFDNRKDCCAAQVNSTFAYTPFKKLKVPVGTPIYECNKRCKCGPDCVNRLVQDGRASVKDTQLAIFRTSTGCGWGVKTLKSIKKGSFVTLYVGEVIDTEEAERRGREYDAEGCTYLFDLDFNEGDCPYTVDTARLGNIGHFLNHSCDPNLAVFAVWVNCLDPSLPKLALFAIKDIPKNSELTFDYQNQISNTGTSEGETRTSEDGHTRERMACLCGSENCRKFLFV